MHPTAERVVCQICKQTKERSQGLPAALVRPPVVEVIQKTYPDWSPTGFICFPDVHHFKSVYFEEMLIAEKGELSAAEAAVVASLKTEEDILSTNLNAEFDQQLAFSQRAADKVAEFGGSWRFIIIFGIFLVIWIIINSIVLLQRPFDPYPFILLNLILSSLAALQAPVIMMSQNRQEAKDRLRAEHDYRVNLKAELEIRHILAKLDLLMTHQWQRLLEIQRLQLELMEDGETERPAK